MVLRDGDWRRHTVRFTATFTDRPDTQGTVRIGTRRTTDLPPDEGGWRPLREG